MKSSRPSNKISVRLVFELVLDDIARYYPFLLAFYAAALVLAVFLPSWSVAIYWPAFHGAVVILGAISLGSRRVRELGLRKSLGGVAASLVAAAAAARRWRPVTNAKLATMILGVGLGLFLGANPWETLVLIYALATILFFTAGARIAIALALALLLVCPVASWLGNNAVADQFAIFAFYFLVITVSSQSAALFKQKEAVKYPQLFKLD